MQEELHEIIIDTVFKGLLPPLDKETYKSLEENIIANGCMFPLVTWENILIDGHNRFAICTEHDIPYKTVEKEFSSREDVVIWIISNQVARRNLTPMQLTYFRGLHYNTVKLKRGNSADRKQNTSQILNNSTFEQENDTASRLSRHYKVHPGTIYTDAKTSKAIDAIGSTSPEAKSMILSGDVQIDKKELQRLASATEDEVRKVAFNIASGAYLKSDTKKQADIDMSEPTGGSAADGSADNGNTPGQRLQAQSTNTFVSAETGRAYRAFTDIAASGTKAQIRKALRAFINELEVLLAKV